jgi:hypothetical protein
MRKQPPHHHAAHCPVALGRARLRSRRPRRRRLALPRPWREHQISLFASALRFGAVADQFGSPLALPLQRKWRACAAAQQPLQAGAVLCLDGDTGVHREAAVSGRGRQTQARSKPVDEGHCTEMHRRLVKNCRPWGVAQQAMRDDPQKDAQRTNIRPCALSRQASWESPRRCGAHRRKRAQRTGSCMLGRWISRVGPWRCGCNPTSYAGVCRNALAKLRKF